MKLVVQLYIDTSGNPSNEPVYERLDLFDFEDIELTSTIQDVKDIGNVFTDYSQEFTVPASQKNNKILKHYYNNQLAEGFDARIKQRGLILINGITFKQGFIRLSESTITKSKPSSYRLTFFGSLVNLKQALGDDEIKDLLGLQIYNHEYSRDNVYDGFVTGLGLIGDNMVESSNRDIIYPAISASNKWYYSTDVTKLGEQDYRQGKQVNIWTNGDTSLQYGIDYLQLKPAIKVKHIISAIEETYAKYGVVFSEDFFNSVDFNQLYMLMHNKKGILSTSKGGSEDEEAVSYVVGTGDSNSPFQYNDATGDGELRPLQTYLISNPSYEIDVVYRLTLQIQNVTGTDVNYGVEFLNGTDVLNSVEDLNVKNLLHVARNICPIKNRHIEADRNFHAGMQGSTSSGIAPAYSDFYNRTNQSNNQQYLPPPLNVDNMLLEGAQGFYLDIYHGQYPYVTSSHISPAFAAASFGFSPKKIRNIIGVAKCYETRSGKDPYFDYLMDDMGVLKQQEGFNFSFEDIYEDIQKVGHEFGVTTGRKRQIRFLDVSRLINSINATGTTHVVINKWDILEELDACCYFYNTNLFVCDKESMFPEVEALIHAYCKDVKKVFYSASKTNDIDWKWLND